MRDAEAIRRVSASSWPDAIQWPQDEKCRGGGVCHGQDNECTGSGLDRASGTLRTRTGFVDPLHVATRTRKWRGKPWICPRLVKWMPHFDSQRMESCLLASEKRTERKNDGATQAAYDAICGGWRIGQHDARGSVAVGHTGLGVDVVGRARHACQTTGPHRFARVDESALARCRFKDAGCPSGGRQGRHVVVTQGFIGRHRRWQHIHLRPGRLGLQCGLAWPLPWARGSVTIWKDVPGMMNADPKRHPRRCDGARGWTMQRPSN